jgi:hypothetical protein
VLLILDECIGDRGLFRALVTAGHDVVRSIDELGGGADDSAVFLFARNQRRTVITYNNGDFKLLSEQYPDHAGLLLVYQDNKPTDMTVEDIVRAIANVEATFPQGISSEVLVLNGFLWKSSNP